MIVTKHNQSSMRTETQYDPESLILKVIFKKGGSYDYPGVSESIHQELVKASSVGKFFHSNIRGKYEAHKSEGKAA